MVDDARTSDWRTRALSLAVGCVLWEIAARVAATPFFPTCLATAAALVGLFQSGLILANLSVSIGNLLIGYGSAVIVGIAVGIAMSRFGVVEFVVRPYLYALLAAPGLVYVPILFTLFGTSRITQIGSVFLHAVFLITTTTAGALRVRNATLIAMAKAFGATGRQIFWSIRWREARPLVFSGLRVGAVLAVRGMINGEMFIAFTGLGALVRTYGARFEADRVLAIVIVIVVVAFVSTALVDLAERRASATA
jgi:NitT/TauT family transport system permease protein